MRSRVTLVRIGLAVYVSVLLVLLAIRFAPFMGNRDDFVRYYFGGYVGSVQFRSLEKSRVLQDEIEDAIASLPSTHIGLRLYAGKTPYVPFFIATTPIGMAMFDRTSGVHPTTWILGFHTLLWVLGIAAGAVFVSKNPQICSTPWFLAAGVVLAWLNPHTSPFLPVPRGVSTLAAGLALVCYISGAKTRFVIFFLVVGSFFHAIQHLVNIGAIFLFLLLIWSDQPLQFLKSARTWTIGGIAVFAALVGVAIVWFANSMSFPNFSEFLDVTTEYDVWRNWDVNREAFETSARELGPLLLILVFLEKGWKRALRCAALFIGGLAAVALVGPSGAYGGEYVQRIAGVWSLILFALLVNKDLFRELTRPVLRSPWLATGIVLLGLVFLWKSFDAWNPADTLDRFELPSEKAWGPVETECLRMLADPV